MTPTQRTLVFTRASHTGCVYDLSLLSHRDLSYPSHPFFRAKASSPLSLTSSYSSSLFRKIRVSSFAVIFKLAHGSQIQTQPLVLLLHSLQPRGSWRSISPIFVFGDCRGFTIVVWIGDSTCLFIFFIDRLFAFKKECMYFDFH